MRRRIIESFRRLHAILGVPGLLIGVFSLGAMLFGCIVMMREYDDIRQTRRDTMRDILAGWARTVPIDYLNVTLADYADTWRRAPDSRRTQALTDLRWAVGQLGAELDPPGRRSPLVHVTSLELSAENGGTIGKWSHAGTSSVISSEEVQRIPLLAGDDRLTGVDLTIRYRLDPTLIDGFSKLEAPYHRLLLALLGLSGYPLLCLVYMFLQARALRDRAARESAQAATLDLADRTCHELGNVAFVLANERRNLADHLDLVDRFLLEGPDAIRNAAKRAGLDASQTERFLAALGHEYANRGIDPDVEMYSGAMIAREVCRQIAVASDYISLTVRELDGYLKQSALPVRLEPLDVRDMLKDAATLLGPRLASGAISVERHGPDDAIFPLALADRRLLVHILVNLLKNAAEAASDEGREPLIRASTRVDGDWIVLTLTDNGPGIAPELLPHIFDFGVSTKGAGRGRGLAIVRESMESQGGRITASSIPDTGTTFTLILPRALSRP